MALTGADTDEVLTTARLRLRAPRAEDAEALHRLLDDWAVLRMLSHMPFPYERRLTEAWIDEAIALRARGRAVHLVIAGEEAGGETVVGCIGVEVDPATRVGRLGYWVGRRFWGHGVAAEAVARVKSWALAVLEIDRIEATVARDNLASIAVLRRCGFAERDGGTELFRARGSREAVLVFTAGRDEGGAAVEAGAKPLVLVAACALIDSDGRVLLARRPEGRAMAGLWEFPGGKLAAGETPEAALIRELREELGIDVATACLAPFAFASHEYERFHLLMPLYVCRRWKGIPRGREGQTLAWVRGAKLGDYKMPAADKPLVPLLRDLL